MKNILKVTAGVLCWLSLSATGVAATITVLDENGSPIRNAEVLIGQSQNDPFVGNLLKTDGAGRVHAPAAWNNPQPVTINQSGYVITTFQNLAPQNHQLRISTQESQSTFDVQGTTAGFGKLQEDGKVDFGLVFPAIPVNNLVRFDMASVVSPVSDKITVLGRDVFLPSNITLPPQDESYIFSVHFDKPNYLMPLRQSGHYTMTALHGQFPLQKVVNEIRSGKSMIQTLNHFVFLETGLKTISVTKSVSTEHMDVNQFQFKEKSSVTAPTFPSNQFMLTVALSEDQGIWKPTDLKKLNSNETRQMVTNSSLGTSKFLSVLTTQTGTSNLLDSLTKLLWSLSGTFVDMEPLAAPAGAMNYQQFSVAVSNQPQFLELTAAPTVSAVNVSVKVPALPAGLSDAGSMLILSQIERSTPGSSFEKRTRIWEHSSPKWIASFNLPSINAVIDPTKEYRWEILFLAKDGSSNQITHVTRNAIGL